jgi:S-adenosylmethionine decarboxylase proenzyme
MVGAAEKAKATIVNSTFHTFNPFGVSGVVVIAESHLTIHTWPEYNFASLDVYTCGEEVDPWIAFEYLKEKFEPKSTSVMEIKRGILSSVKNLKHK